MILSRAQTMLTMHEGYRLKPYRCSAGKLTVAIGRNLDDKGISKKEALFMLTNDIRDCEHDLAKLIFPNQFYAFPEDIQLVLIDMRFQLGRKGFRGFKKMIFAFQENDYLEAILQMKDSKWYGQTQNRANDLINMIKKQMQGGDK